MCQAQINLLPSKKLLKKLDKYIPGASSFIDTRIFDDDKQALVEIASSLILASEKKKKLGKIGSKTGKRRQFSKLTKQKVLISQNFQCAKCKDPLEIADFDHIDGDKTNNDISNCQALCPNCHARKTRKKF